MIISASRISGILFLEIVVLVLTLLSLCIYVERERERERAPVAILAQVTTCALLLEGAFVGRGPSPGRVRPFLAGGWTLFFEWRLEAHRATFPAQTPQTSLWETEICPGENVYGRGGYIARSIHTRMGVEFNMGLGRVLLLREFRTFAAMARTGNAEVPIEIDADISTLGSESGGNRAEGPSPTKKRERPFEGEQDRPDGRRPDVGRSALSSRFGSTGFAESAGKDADSGSTSVPEVRSHLEHGEDPP